MKPVIISTGIAELADIELAVETCKKVGNNDIALLKCTSSYPAPLEEANLKMIKDMNERFGLVTGLSDHTLGIIAPIISVAFGAKIIEKHFILDRSIGGPDATFSLNEAEFKEMVDSVRNAQKSIGEVNYELTPKQKNGKIFTRSLYVTDDILKDEIITTNNVRSIRPGFGLHPKYYKDILGKNVKVNLKKGERFNLSSI